MMLHDSNYQGCRTTGSRQEDFLCFPNWVLVIHVTQIHFRLRGKILNNLVRGNPAKFGRILGGLGT